MFYRWLSSQKGGNVRTARSDSTARAGYRRKRDIVRRLGMESLEARLVLATAVALSDDPASQSVADTAQVGSFVSASSETGSEQLALADSSTCFDHLITDKSLELAVPAIPLPGYLEPFIDPVFGTRVIRVTDPGNPIPLPGVDPTWGPVARHHYSTDQAWNADQSLLMLDRGTPGASLFLDGDTYQPLFLKEPPGRFRWHPTDPDLLIFVDGNRIGTWNVLTEEVNVLASLEGYSEFDEGPNQGMSSNDGTKIAVAGFNPAGKEVIFVYDLAAQHKYPDFSLPAGTSSVTISPLGNYVVVSGDLDGVDQTQVYDLEGNKVGPFWSEFHRPGHFDVAVDENGDEVAVGRSKSDPDKYLVIKRRLSDGLVTVVADAGASHTSTRNLGRPEWAYLSYNDPSLGPYFAEVVAARLDGSLDVQRLVHTHAVINEYVTEPHASPSPDGMKVIFASNWDDPHGNVAAYVVELCRDPSTVLPTVNLTVIDDTATETGDDTATIEVTRTGDTSEDLTLHALYTVGGTAGNGTDYRQLNGVVTIPAGATKALIEIVAIDDLFAEPSETVTIELSPAASYTLGASASGTVTIVDGDVTDHLFVVESRVSASSDDAEESSSGKIERSSSDLEMVREDTLQTVGIRFAGLPIPWGATITNAYVQFQVDEANSEAAALIIQGQAADNATTFTSTNYGISSRLRTASQVSWSPAAWPERGSAGPDQQTPDLASVIQEVVNRSGWASGNSLALIITGSGKRVAESFDGDQQGAPLLHVEYTTGVVGNRAPVAEGQSVTTQENTAVAITLSAHDPNGDPLTFDVVSGPSHGVLSGTGSNRTYTPDSDFFGTDSFTFWANDGQAWSNVATATIEVTEIIGPETHDSTDTPLTLADAHPRNGRAKRTASTLAISSQDTAITSIGTLQFAISVDGGGTSMTDLSAVLTGPSRKKQSIPVLTSGIYGMPDFEGQSLAGNWTLEITDSVSNSPHVLTSWSLVATPFQAVSALAATGNQAVLTDQAIDPDASNPSRSIPRNQLAAILWLDAIENLEQGNSAIGNETEDPEGVDRVLALWE
ncbi:MAG: cadherin-like domain-containing protein [Rhodopirellula sp.]|nr:cadherin-like domain-containing protein [Rhodopirellula sp.]